MVTFLLQVTVQSITLLTALFDWPLGVIEQRIVEIDRLQVTEKIVKAKDTLIWLKIFLTICKGKYISLIKIGHSLTLI